MNAVLKLQKRIKELEEKIDTIQRECSHPKSAREQTYKGSTGNYDPSADCYWIENKCNLCFHKWNEDQ